MTCDHPAVPGPVLIPLRPRSAVLPPQPPPAPAAVPWFHAVPPGGSTDSEGRPLVLLVDRSALVEVQVGLHRRLLDGDRCAEEELAEATAVSRLARPRRDTIPGALPPPRAVSLNVAQSCNLSCAYCYADEGRFSGRARMMPREVAIAAVNDLIGAAEPGDRVTVGFIGGEPFLNRSVLREATEHAVRVATARGVDIGFSVTTNGTLLSLADVDLLRDHAFTVTVSLDGGAAVHDRHRPAKNGDGSWQRAIERIRPLLGDPGRCQVSARATVTHDDLDVAARVRALVDVGLPSVGVSPARTGPVSDLLLRGEDWEEYLAGLVAAADEDVERLRTGHRHGWSFANLASAMTEIHQGTARPLPCGAGLNYVSVDVEGRYATCHRTIGDARYDLGALGGLSPSARDAFLGPRLVDRQQPCASCWARYLCGGGCHAEVDQVGRDSCGMIRGWLDHCLQLYPAMRASFPELFG